MNGTNLNDTLSAASLGVLETMFFTDATPLEEIPEHTDQLACQLHCSGAVEGTFSVAVDRDALVALCEAFYGEGTPTTTQPFELLCELTNMIAGSTLSVYSPDRFCPLSSPQLSDPSLHLASSALPDTTFLSFAIDGGVISLACSLRTK